MELSKQEERLINTIRAINQVNPMGVEGRTSESLMEILLRVSEGSLDGAKKAHERFIEESKRDRIVDLAYYKAPLYEDGNRYIDGKQVLKRFGDGREIPAPEIAKPEKPVEEFEDDIPAPDKPIEEWTEEEHEAYEAALWDSAEEGCIEYTVKTLEAPTEMIDAAIQVLDAIRTSCEDSAARLTLRNEFDHAPAWEVLRLLRRRFRISRETSQSFL